MTTDVGRPLAVEQLPWAEVLPGIEIRMLRVDPDGKRYAMMMRAQPGAMLPRHRHLGDVHAITHAGRWRYDDYDWIAEPGTYVHEPAGSVHTFHVPDDESDAAVITFFVEGPQEILDDDGSVASLESGATIEGYYRAFLEAQAELLATP
ncbi:MAG: 2,4'-dihydroxyacetophenone dioxygenase family protein [Polyangiales bacterium]